MYSYETNCGISNFFPARFAFKAIFQGCRNLLKGEWATNAERIAVKNALFFLNFHSSIVRRGKMFSFRDFL